MDTLDMLVREHRVIDRALDAMLVWAAGVRNGTRTDDKNELRRFVTFLREFVDECHHAKEEQILFAAMKANGFGSASGPVGVMLHEHEQGRALLANLDGFSHGDEPWSDAQRHAVSDLALVYATLLRQHIIKEDTILYPMARARLPEDTHGELARLLAHFERVEMGHGKHEQLHRLAKSLIAVHLPSAA